MYAARLRMPHCSRASASLRATPRTALTRWGTRAAAAAPLPTLGDTGIKFNGSRWQGGAEEGMSVFDMKGAMEALQKARPAAPARSPVLCHMLAPCGMAVKSHACGALLHCSPPITRRRSHA
jgi:hypothetical protein